METNLSAGPVRENRPSVFRPDCCQQCSDMDKEEKEIDAMIEAEIDASKDIRICQLCEGGELNSAEECDQCGCLHE